MLTICASHRETPVESKELPDPRMGGRLADQAAAHTPLAGIADFRLTGPAPGLWIDDDDWVGRGSESEGRRRGVADVHFQAACELSGATLSMPTVRTGGLDGG
jgi:hypothetical protein